MISEHKGMLIVISSPSGVGKTTLVKLLAERNKNFVISISNTTRIPRKNEIEGKDYYFINEKKFNDLIKTKSFYEYARVFNNLYGTLKDPVIKNLSQGKNVLFDIDWQGTQQLSEIAREDLVTVFILPPARSALEKRLRNRSKDTMESESDIRGRMEKAADEMSHYTEYDYVIINEDVDEAIRKAQLILDAERIKRRRMVGLSEFVRGLKGGL